MIVGGKNNLIGISGKIGSGKDTLGIVIKNCADSGCEIKKFADKLKDIACLLIGCTRRQLEDRGFKEKELGEEWWQYGLIRENTRKPILYPSKKEDIEKQLKVFNNARMYINKLTPRKLLQLLGTECGREIIHPNIWVNALFADYVCDNCGQQECPTGEEHTGQMIDSSFPNWIITDVRFPNEAQAIKDRGGIVIRVNRFKIITKTLPDGTECSFIPNPLFDGEEHPSETALDDYEFDHVIDNNGSIDELIGKIKQLNLV